MIQTEFGDRNEFELKLEALTERVRFLEKELENKLDKRPTRSIVVPGSYSNSKSRYTNSSQKEHEPLPETKETIPEPEIVENKIPEIEKPLYTEENKPKEKVSLETRIGLVWLNRLGITSLVIGVALFIIYSYHSFGPILKLSVGILTSIGLILSGELFEKKLQNTVSLADRLWGRTLIGGGWALLYFTGYAAYHIPGVKLLSNALVEDFLLTGICLSALRHASGKNAQIIAIMAVLLSFTTIGFSQIGIGTVVWLLVLAIRAMFVAASMKWHTLLMLTTVFGYWSYLFVVAPKLPLPYYDFGQNITTLISMTLFWLTCHKTSVNMENSISGGKANLFISTILNGICYLYIGTCTLANMQGSIQLDYLVPLFAGLVYCSSYKPNIETHLFSLSSLRLLLGLTCVTLAISMYCNSEALHTSFWLIEIVLLAYLGIKYDIRLMRLYAYGLSALTVMQKLNVLNTAGNSNFYGIQYSQPLFHNIFTIAIFAICWYLFKTNIDPIKTHMFGRLYFFNLLQLFIWYLPVSIAGYIFPAAEHSRLSAEILGWMIQYSVIFYFSMNSDYPSWRISAIAGFIAFGANSFMLKDEPFIATMIVFVYLGAALFCHFQKEFIGPVEKVFNYRIYATGAAIFSWYHTFALADANMEFLALRWAAEAAALIGIGYWLRDRYTRNSGIIFLSTVLILLIFRSGHWNGFEDTFIVAIFYLMGQTYRHASKEFMTKDEREFSHFFETAGSIVMTKAIWDLVPSEWLTACLSAEGLVLLLIGFVMPDKTFRLSGLAVFMLLGIKLLFVDLASARTDARILSFILAGIILLLSSYIYTKWVPRLLSADR